MARGNEAAGGESIDSTHRANASPQSKPSSNPVTKGKLMAMDFITHAFIDLDGPSARVSYPEVVAGEMVSHLPEPF